jgi:tetratricopeptide (TPR) repeat protein
MAAPMMVWEPPSHAKRDIHSIAIAPISGQPDLASKLNEAMVASQPQIGRPIALLDPKKLEELTSIQLAGFDGQPSDIAGLSAARRANASVLLQGEIVKARTEPQEPPKSRFDLRKRPSEEITVSWIVTDVETGERLASKMTTIDRETAEKNYPDIKAMNGEPMERLILGAARESWAMLTPKTRQEDAILVMPWFLPGASKIRKGDGYARQGRWDLAETQWQDAASKHHWNNAAWHNLALAAVAREDFELARKRLEHAKTLLPNDRADKTERWVDTKQHDYHRSLGLGDREGGWLTPDPPPPVESSEVPSADPRDIDKLPWWTAVPGSKPPGWTWKQWMTQPVVY